jgi:acyl carrier protein
MQPIEREVRQFVIDNFLFTAGNGQFSSTDSFLETGLVDSMGILNLVEFVREKYSICIADEELVPEHWDSVQQVVAYVQSKLAAIDHPAAASSREMLRATQDS